MAFRILDASAFYAGIPFGSPEKSHTTSLVYGEISHIKRGHGALDALLDTGRLVIIDPQDKYTDAAVAAAKGTGDYTRLSRQDVSVIALCIEYKGEIVSDDYSVANVAKSLGLRVDAVMTGGIKKSGRWKYYCPACKSGRDGGTECRVCGGRLRRRLSRAGSFGTTL